jgi:4-diphosphocytidyl-2-C-methyl-D-erythritol kinase
MLIAHAADTVTVQAPAKVNLFLEVLAKRPDGYHDIATVMVAVGLHDTLEIREDTPGEIRLLSDHPSLTTGPDNLICRAAALLRQQTGCSRGARIQLRKRIPLAAGLAGGSADAAATLLGLNRLWGLGLAPAELARLGSQVGSDVAFFFALPAAWCTGRGEIVQPLTLGRPLWFLLVCPGVGLSTAEVYRGVRVPATPVAGDAIRAALAVGDVARVGRHLHNRLQEPAERLCPAVARWRQRLAPLGPAGVLMSGSGSSVFALCREESEAQRLAGMLAHVVDQESSTPNGGEVQLFLVRSCD